MTPEEFANLQRKFLIKTEKESAFALLAEFEAVKREISRALMAEELKNISFVSRILEKYSQNFDNLAILFQRIVKGAQRNVLSFARESVGQYLSQRTSVFDPDIQALNKLIGRTQNGTSLSKFFSRMKPDIETRAKAVMLESFSLGESNRQMAKKLNDVSNVGLSRALTISRTETNEAFRAASRDFYAQNDIRSFIWMANLDPRTCVICWSLHGRKFSSAKKVFSHPNCRCVLIPVIKDQKKIITGAEKFASLETGFQKQILGAKRFEMFESGKGLNDFVSVLEDKENRQKFFIKNLLT